MVGLLHDVGSYVSGEFKNTGARRGKNIQPFILDLIERVPTYPQRVLKYAMNNISDVELLPESIDLEVFKIFSFEPQAFALDDANGDTALEVPFLGIVNVWVECSSQEEFIFHRIASHVEGFENMFIERYPAQKDRIRAEFERAVDKYGTALLGPSAYGRVKVINDSVVSKMMAQRTWDAIAS